ncbi:transcriptional regulator [Curtobacterium sp. MCBD17_019]|nr:transcriptional regulator [Curtobacterium sp. MCBD17_019]
MEPLLLTPAEAAKALGIGRSTLYALLADGTLPSVKIGAARRVRSSDLRRYVDSLSSLTV